MPGRRRNRDRELVFDPRRQDQSLSTARVRRGGEEDICHVFNVFVVSCVVMATFSLPSRKRLMKQQLAIQFEEVVQ